MKEALFYKKLKNNIVQCVLCPNFCVIKENNKGVCLSRKNISGKLVSLTYGKPVAMHIDPIEKKPLYHFIPGTKSFSIGTAGCTLKCLFCQNAEIAQVDPKDFSTNKFIEPKNIVKEAINKGCQSISYTYNEPVSCIEYVLDIAKLARKNKIRNIIVSNGYINEEPLKKLCKYIDAANIDLKGFTEEFYKNNCLGKLKPVLNALKILKKNKVWLEITNLIIPGLNDNPIEIEKMCNWIKDNLGTDVPLHFSRFFPMYKLTNKEETSAKTLESAYNMAKKQGIKYIYIGNIKTDKENTYCHNCNSLLIERNGYSIIKNNIKNNSCYKCNVKIPGIFN